MLYCCRWIIRGGIGREKICVNQNGLALGRGDDDEASTASLEPTQGWTYHLSTLWLRSGIHAEQFAKRQISNILGEKCHFFKDSIWNTIYLRFFLRIQSIFLILRIELINFFLEFSITILSENNCQKMPVVKIENFVKIFRNFFRICPI